MSQILLFIGLARLEIEGIKKLLFQVEGSDFGVLGVQGGDLFAVPLHLL